MVRSRKPALSRRGFLATATLAATGLFVPRAARSQCELTTPDILGPYHVDDAPLRTVLASADEPGTRLFIDGHVYVRDCTGPVAGAVVDVWHATDAGCYSVHQDCPDEDPFNCRGQMITDSAGTYAFETVLPGWYGSGGTFRPRHLHLIISPPDGAALTTQIYFAGDPYIDGDPFASDPAAAARIIPLVEDGAALRGVVDINLDVDTTTAVPGDEHGLPTATTLLQNFPNPFNPMTTIRFQLRVAAMVSLDVFTTEGRLVRTLVRGERESGYHTVRWDGRDQGGRGVPSGVYLYRLQAGGRIETRKMHLIR
jgi:catechol 1,2-dioxygenase